MDTLVSNSPAAMGPGEQQAVHPFFRQGNTDSDDRPRSQLTFNSDFATKASSTLSSSVPPETPKTAFACPVSSLDSQNFGSENLSQPSALNYSESQTDQASAPMGQDDDPNASRRKRRKTTKASNTEQEATLQSGLSGWLGKGAPSTASTADNEPQPSTTSLRLPPSPETSKGTREQEASSTDEKATGTQNGGKRRTLKLNANGRQIGRAHV